jgi:hypothetical protein
MRPNLTFVQQNQKEILMQQSKNAKLSPASLPGSFTGPTKSEVGATATTEAREVKSQSAAASQEEMMPSESKTSSSGKPAGDESETKPPPAKIQGSGRGPTENQATTKRGWENESGAEAPPGAETAKATDTGQGEPPTEVTPTLGDEGQSGGD